MPGIHSLQPTHSTFHSWVSMKAYLQGLSQVDQTTLAGLALFMTFFLVATAFFVPIKLKSKYYPGSSQPLQALSMVITPTSEAWPEVYGTLLDYKANTSSRTIRIKLSAFLCNLYAGSIELRDPCDLSLLLSYRLQVYGWNLYLGVDSFYWACVFHWVLKTQISASEHNEDFSVKRGFDKHKYLLEATSLDLHYLSLARDSRNYTNLVTYLDFVPYSDLESTIRRAQRHLRPGTSVSFEFTTIASNIPFLSDQFIFCCLPFMSRRYSKTTVRTSTPLLLSLHRVTELLTSGPSVTTIETVLNSTAEHVLALQLLEQRLSMDRVTRSFIIQKWGLHAWREHKFMILWEAALLLEGCLTRWTVIIRK